MHSVDYVFIIAGIVGAIMIGAVFYSAHVDAQYELQTMSCNDLKSKQQYYLRAANNERPDSFTSRHDEYKSDSETYRLEFISRCDEPNQEPELTFEEKLQIDYQYEIKQRECSKLEFDIGYYNRHLKTANPDSQLNNDYERYQWKLEYVQTEYDKRCK